MDSRLRGNDKNYTNDKNDALFLETALTPREYKKSAGCATTNRPKVIISY